MDHFGQAFKFQVYMKCGNSSDIKIVVVIIVSLNLKSRKNQKALFERGNGYLTAVHYNRNEFGEPERKAKLRQSSNNKSLLFRVID